MPEPSLSEIANITVDAERGGGELTPVLGGGRGGGGGLVDTLNDQAKFQADLAWKKYTQFLENKKELFKNIGEIQGLDVAPEDRETLNGQAGDILKDIMNDPKIAMGGRGYDELMVKMAKFKSSSVASKMDKLDYDTNKLFLDRNPDLYTDENVAMLENNRKKPLGTRESVMLQMPTIFDEKGTFEGIVKNATHDYSAVVGADGKEGGQGYIETGSEINPNAISDLWNLALKGQKDKYGHSIMGAVKKQYDALPKAEHEAYEKAGGIEKFFTDRGQKYLNAYFPEGSYEKTKEGNYRFGKKMAADPNFLGAEKLDLAKKAQAQKAWYDRARIQVDWGELKLKETRLKDETTADLGGARTVINEMASILSKGTPQNLVDPNGKKVEGVIRISDPTLLQSFGNIDKDNKTTNVPDAINYDTKTNQGILLYFKDRQPEYDKDGNVIQGSPKGEYYEREIAIDQRTLLKHITKRSFPNKDIGKINNLVDDFLTANGDDFYGVSKKVLAQNQAREAEQAAEQKAAAEKAAAPAANKKYKTKGGISYSLEELHKMGYSDERINKYIKEGKLK